MLTALFLLISCLGAMFGASCKPQNVDRKVDELYDVPDQLSSHDDEPFAVPLSLSGKIK